MNTPNDNQDTYAKEPSAMEQEINYTRERIGRTVEELEQRLSPGQLVDQALGFARDHGGEFASNLAGSVRRNPLPMLVTGIGLIWLLKSQSSKSTQDSSHRIYTPYGEGDSSYGGGSSEGQAGIKDRLAGIGETIKSKVAGVRSSASSVGDSVTESVRSAKSSLTDRMQDTSGSVQSTTQSIRDKVGGATQTARERARQAKDEFGTLMEEQPLLMGAVGVAIGATLAALAPTTRRERDMLGDASDKVASKASELAAQGYENLRETASQSVSEFTRSLREGADESGSAQTDAGGARTDAGATADAGKWDKADKAWDSKGEKDKADKGGQGREGQGRSDKSSISQKMSDSSTDQSLGASASGQRTDALGTTSNPTPGSSSY